jgi:hypothetical protein
MMYTVKDINNVFQGIVTDHKQLNSFYTNTEKELDINKITVNLFPLLYAQVSEAEVNDGFTTYTYEVNVADLLIEEQTDNIIETYQNTFLILQDVIALFRLDQSDAFPNVGNQAWGIDMPIRCTPFTSQYDNLLTGWSCQFAIRVPNPLNLCVALF